MTNSDDHLVELIEELLVWTRLLARNSVVVLLTEVLNDQRHLLAYEATDGTKTQKEVGEASGLSQATISGLWQKWRRLGIARDVPGGVRHLLRPSDLGLTEVAPETAHSERRAR